MLEHDGVPSGIAGDSYVRVRKYAKQQAGKGEKAMRIVIFGGGMQGRVIADNLAARPEKPEIVVADIAEPHGLPSAYKFKASDVLLPADVEAAVEGASVAVLAVPSAIARDALKNLLATGIPVVDVSFTPDPPLDLDALAKKSGSVCVVDCGIAPGLSHILVGDAYARLGGLDTVKILVGGIPQKPPAVFKHAIYFNPCDLIAEYVRPARARENGKEIDPHPLQAEVEEFKDSELGDLKAFLSDGLRSLLTSFPDVPDMWERTLRYPGHLETMTILEELGMFEDASIKSTASALQTRYPAGEFADYLLMVVKASKGGKEIVWRLLDRETDGNSAMSRTTGFTTAAAAMVLARKQFTTPGVHAPEALGKHPEITKIIVEDLSERGVVAKQLSEAVV